ncbi:MAG: segregation/condensation protein A [Lactimicrobium sp.]|jgi:segregation and condensation protein A|uniref:segregation and condensation protein A n=1 Tax=Lactimicrobium sp. TaxID=2563780 RepID=UPI002F35B2A5
MEEFTVTIDKFDGPLDLMLHLIKEKKLDLLNLDMSELCDQYMAYLNSMQQMHLEIASEYLAELASLIEYKSRMMLPGKQDEEPGDEEDPKQKLVRRLLEYQQYKEASTALAQMFEARQQLMGKPLSIEADKYRTEREDQPVQGSPYDLLKAMQRMLHRIQLSHPQERSFSVREISIEDRELEVRARLDRLPDTFRFETLLDDCRDSLPKAIATFLSVLDLARLHILVFNVDENDVIWFGKGGKA